MSDIDDAVALMNTAVETHMGETVTYARAGDSVSLSAVWNSSRNEFDVEQADLVLSGAEVNPLQGDTITRSTGEVYDVTLEYVDAEGVSVKADDIADASNTLWRIPVRKVQS